MLVWKTPKRGDNNFFALLWFQVLLSNPKVCFVLVWFNGISTIVGYLMLNPVYTGVLDTFDM